MVKKRELRWGMHAGGTGAASGKHGYTAYPSHGYTAYPSEGSYHIDPISTVYGRHRGYKLMFADTGGRLGGLLWRDLGIHRSPNEAKQAAKKHFSGYFG